MLTQEEMKRFNAKVAMVEEHFHSGPKIAVEYVDILNALMQVLKERNPETICKMDLSEAELIEVLRNHPFDCPSILGQVRAPYIEVPGSIRGVFAILGKTDGAIWEIRGGGGDPFPSDPFAHNEVEDISMDLADGRLYHDRAFVHRLTRSKLESFRAAAAIACPGVKLPAISA